MPRSLFVRFVKSFAREGRRWARLLMGWGHFWSRYFRYRRMAPSDEKPTFTSLMPRLLDRGDTPIETTYFFQDAWAFQKIVAAAPPRHVDVGSHHKFVSLLAQVVPTTMVDIRALPVQLWNLEFKAGSILDLPFPDASVPSVSSLCVVEHVGLGRYGDPLDPHGTQKAIEELKRIVSADGDLYISLPLNDTSRVYFDAHRVFSEETALRMFEPFEVLERRYIYEDTFGSERRSAFGTGCYHLRPPAL